MNCVVVVVLMFGSRIRNFLLLLWYSRLVLCELVCMSWVMCRIIVLFVVCLNWLLIVLKWLMFIVMIVNDCLCSC